MNFSPSLLRERRRAAGLSQEQVAVAIGRCYCTIRHYESGKTTPPSEIVTALADVIGCSPKAFFAKEAP